MISYELLDNANADGSFYGSLVVPIGLAITCIILAVYTPEYIIKNGLISSAWTVENYVDANLLNLDGIAGRMVVSIRVENICSL